MFKTIALMTFVCIAGIVHATTLHYQSLPTQTNVIEIFTSEGCSSCPPADAWLSTFKQHPDLFTHVIPLAFHVDYWDWLGWADRFSSEAFSNRQRAYVRQRSLSHLYTPGILVNSEEWLPWFKAVRNWPKSQRTPGVLSLQVNDSNVQLSFDSALALTANVAVIGVGVQSEIRNGENRGKSLTHDFVVLHHFAQPLTSTANFKIPNKAIFADAQKLALVAWVSEEDNNHIIQAVAGYWPK